MSIWAIVPVKPLQRGKSRLASVLSADQRYELNRRMLTETVKTLQSVREIEHVLVVSRDPQALAVARRAGAKTLLEDGSPELNVALTRASMLASAYNVRSVLVIPADLPLMDREGLQEVITLGSKPPCAVIIPDRHHEGTNAMLLSPPELIAFDYGEGSFNRHRERAIAADVRLITRDIPSLAIDVDWPEDLEYLGENLNMDRWIENPA